VNPTPSLFSNRFSVLDVSSCDEIDHSPCTPQEPELIQAVPSSPLPRLPRRPHWERRLPSSLTISSTPGVNSLHIQVELETTDTVTVIKMRALIDSGATGRFIDSEYVKSRRIATRTLSRPIPVFNVDGSPNEAGAITEVVSCILRFEAHTERAIFYVTRLGKEHLILGHSWLREHNPEINWQTGKVSMTRCHAQCSTCRADARRIRLEFKAHVRRLDSCRAGPFPDFSDSCEFEEGDNDREDGTCAPIPEDFPLEEGDRLFASSLHPEPQLINATGNISQRLAEAFARNAPQIVHESIPSSFQDFQDVFSKDSFDVLPEKRAWDHAIELVPNATPTNCKVYPLSPNEQVELDKFLEENLATGRIRPSKSPMASPVFFIKKKDGSLRLVQDYRALNAISVKNRYPLPLISELVNRLRGARYFTKLDICWGFNNVRMKEGDEWKAAFRTNRGLYEPLVMFFGLSNSPSTFQTMMNDIFQDLITEGVVCVYLDDILIFTKFKEEHRRFTRLVLERLREHKLFLKPEKCEFEKTQIEYLGLVISEGQIQMDPVKVAGVRDWPAPTNKKEVQSFLGFTNFYRRFIQDFSFHARPLFDLTKKDVKWQWSAPQQQAFDELKQRITSSPILIFPDDDKPFRIEADSSDFATGAVLSQESSDGKWHPVSFLSKSLNSVERNYEIHDKEMLAVIRSLEEWRHFLEGARHSFEIWTDHKNLEYFMTTKKLNRRQARWSLYLSRFEFQLHHRPGRSMGKPDALSRRADHGTGGSDNENLVLLKPELFAIRALEGVMLEGEERDILREIRKGNREGLQEDSVAIAARELRQGKGKSIRSAEWSQSDGLLQFRGKIYVPNDPELRRRIVSLHHDTLVAGHPGRWKTLELVTRNYWWPQMSRYIGQYTTTCDLCVRTKVQRRAPVGELHPVPVPEQRWSTISVDFIVELPESNGHDSVMVVVDSVSKTSHFVPTNTTVTALGSARLYMRNIWKLHGLPDVVLSDRGPQFVADFTRELYRLLGIKLATSTAYHPQTDGQTERVNQELEQYIRLFVNERQNDWDDLLPLAEFQYNNHVHASTQQTPFMLETGRNPRMGFEPHRQSKLESVVDFQQRMADSLSEARSALIKAKDDMARYYNQRRTPAPIFKPGDRVYLDASDIKTTRPSQKLAHRNLGPFVVERQVGSSAYRLRLPRSMNRLHPVFNVVKLTQAPVDPIPGRRAHAPPPPVLVGDGEEYIVERVLDSRVRRGKLQFKVKWKGYGVEEDSWESASDVHADDLVREFYRAHPGAPRVISAISFADLSHNWRARDVTP
jgi:RNase H-like domain found in reverse transcriptase/Reverse transcriptase (RNA-dependent DNA polymerase)/Integrase zinc binding domain/Chromo (CHRromatin Organisation MOdifier) domain